MATEQDESPTPTDDNSPPLLDVSDRPAATPGPLTKPSPTIPQHSGPRWKLLLIAVVIVAVVVAAIVFLPQLFG